MTPSNVYRPSSVRLFVVCFALIAAGVVSWVASSLPFDHAFGTVALLAGAAGLVWHSARCRLELRIEQDALVVNKLRVPWAEVDVSELKERRRGALRFPAFEIMVKDPSSDTGRRTLEILQPKWPRFDELYDALLSFAPRRK